MQNWISNPQRLIAKNLSEWIMRQEFEELASEIFDTEEIYVIHELIQYYCGSDDDYLAALSRLRYVIPRRPKRPMYYVHHQIGFLPGVSRFVVEQSGSYLEKTARRIIACMRVIEVDKLFFRFCLFWVWSW